jgi:hypothetical protein
VITSSAGGDIGFLNRRTATTATFFYRPPVAFSSGLVVAIRSNGLRYTLAIAAGGTFTMTGLTPGSYLVYVAGMDVGNTITMLSNVLRYEHPATSAASGDGFKIEWRTNYNDVWDGDEYDKDTIRERIVMNATANWMQWRLRGCEYGQRLVLRNVQIEARMLGPAQAATET